MSACMDMDKADARASETIDRPAQLIGCVVCASARPFDNVEIAPNARQHKAGYDGDRLVCQGCRSTLVSVYARVGPLPASMHHNQVATGLISRSS